MAICELCNKSAAESRYGVLVDIKDKEISEWTFNIITIKYCEKLCLKCCQDLSLVGELLFKWHHKIDVDITSAKAPIRVSYSASKACGEKTEEAFDLKLSSKDNYPSELEPLNANSCNKDDLVTVPDTGVSQGDEVNLEHPSLQNGCDALMHSKPRQKLPRKTDLSTFAKMTVD